MVYPQAHLGLKLLKGLLGLVDEQIFRRNGSRGYYLELIAGDTRLIALAELADGADKLAYAVVLGDRLTDGGVRGIDAVCLVQRIEYMVFALESVQIQAVIVGLIGTSILPKEEFSL